MRRLLYLLCCFIPITSFANVNHSRDTLSYSIDTVNVVGFYRDNVKVRSTDSREWLQKINIAQEPTYVLTRRPSIIAYSDTGNECGYTYLRMRGIDQTRINMTLDGMPLNEGEDQGVYFSNYPDMLSSMHSMKVTNGASITGNGVAGYAGSVDFESIDLLRDTTSNAYVGYGSWNTLKSALEYNTGLYGKLAGYFRINHQQTDAYRKHAYNNAQSVFVKLGYFINELHSVDFLNFIGFSRNGQGWIGSTPDELESDFSSNGCVEEEIDKFIQNISKLQYRGYVNDAISLTSSVYYNHLSGGYNFDVDNYMRRIVDHTWTETGEIDDYDLNHHMYGANIAAKVRLDKFRITAGLNATIFSRRHIGTNNLQSEKLWDNTGYKNDLNAFVKGEYSFNGLMAGVNIQYRHADFAYDGDKPFKKINWDFLNWSANIRWQISDANSLYAVVTQTHREPTRSDMFGGEENFNQLITAQAEAVIDYELGYNLQHKDVSGNINVYYMDFSNELILNGAMGTNGLPIRENVAQSYRAGIELSLTYSPVDRLKLINSSSWSMNRVNTGDEVLTHVMSPTWITRQDIIYGLGRLEIGAAMNYRSSMFFELTNKYKIGSRTRFDIFAEYDFGHIVVSTHINNLFDKRSFANGMIGAGGPLYFVESPRNFFVDLRIYF